MTWLCVIGSGHMTLVENLPDVKKKMVLYRIFLIIIMQSKIFVFILGIPPHLSRICVPLIDVENI